MMDPTDIADVRTEAAAWVVRLQDAAVTDADLVAFDAWLDAAAEHRRAYEQALDAWLRLSSLSAPEKELRTSPPPPARRAAAPSASRARRRWAPLAIGALAASLVAAAVTLALWPPVSQPAQGLSYATSKGERRTVKLADGTELSLNTATRVSVDLAGRDRRIRLADGEIALKVTHDPARPFTVLTNGAVIRDIGTEFNVRARDGALEVSVAQGEVAVQSQAGRGPAVRVTQGEKLAAAAGGGGLNLVKANPEDDLDWTRGQLVLRNQALASVVAELNLYFAKPIRIDDPKLAQRPVSGVLRLEDEASTLRSLALFAPLQVVSMPEAIVLAPRP